jgi:hypothetical protein
MDLSISARKGVLSYGSVDLCLYQGYPAGDTVRVHRNLYMEVVDRVEKADGIVVLGLQPVEGQTRPTCHCVLFTHYFKHVYSDRVDHMTTVLRLTQPSESIRLATEKAFHLDLIRRSITASFAYNPSVRYL